TGAPSPGTGPGPRTLGRHRTAGSRRTVAARAGQTRLAACRAANLPPALLSGPTSRTPADSTSSRGRATSPSPTPLQCCVTSRPATSPLATPLLRPATTPLLDQDGARGWLTPR